MKKTSLSLLLLSLLPTLASAHPGHLLNNDWGLGAGLTHPFTGLDHLTMFVASGIILSLCHRKPLTLFTLTLGLVAGIGLGSFLEGNAIIEYSVAFTLLVLALFLFFKKIGNFAVFLLPLMALVHGLAHGTEIPTGAALGFTMGSAISAAAIAFTSFYLVKPFANNKWLRASITATILGALGVVIGA